MPPEMPDKKKRPVNALKPFSLARALPHATCARKGTVCSTTSNPNARVTGSSYTKAPVQRFVSSLALRERMTLSGQGVCLIETFARALRLEKEHQQRETPIK